jgi:hypothetical protein
MNTISTLILVACASFFPAVAVGAEERSFTAAGSESGEFTHLLRNRPLDLGQLLGKHFSEVVPGTSWEGLPSPEECKNPAIRYGVFVRSDLHDYMKNWDFMTDDYCVSNYSMFLLFFNRGFVFRVQLRYIPDSFAGTVEHSDPGYCADEFPIFKMIARKLGGTVVARQGSYEVKQYTSKYVMTLAVTGEHATTLSWDLRGAPCFQSF